MARRHRGPTSSAAGEGVSRSITSGGGTRRQSERLQAVLLAVVAVAGFAVAGVGAVPGTAVAANETTSATATTNATTQTPTDSPTQTTVQTPRTPPGPIETLAGSGTAADPYVVTNATELRAVNQDVDAHFVLANDVDAAGVTVTGLAGEYGIYHDASDRPFNGTFDGQGHAIRNLAIDEREGALFAAIGRSGVVRNLALRDVDVSGSAALADVSYGTIENVTVTGTVQEDAAGAVAGVVAVNGNAGTIRDARVNVSVNGGRGSPASPGAAGIAGSNDGLIADVHVDGHFETGPEVTHAGGVAAESTGTIRNATVAATIEGGSNVGGVVGDVWRDGRVVDVESHSTVEGVDEVGGVAGTVGEDASLFRALARGEVRGERSVGGLVGQANGPVTESAATATVVGTRYDEGVKVGGLVGDLDGAAVTDSYATGDVTGHTAVGGLVGESSGEIRRAYAVGVVEGERGYGPAIGEDYTQSEDVEALYYDDARSIGSHDPVATGLSTSEMSGADAGDALAGFDVGGTWATTEQYPVLAWQGDQWYADLMVRLAVPDGEVRAGDSIALDASGSTVARDEITSNEWSISGTSTTDESVDVTASGATVSPTITTPGQYDVTVTVRTAGGMERTATDDVTVVGNPARLPGNGTEADPYRIDAASDLLAVEQAPGAHYVLTRDVDANHVGDWNGGSGLPPIGGPGTTADPTAFTGTLDGQGHAITGLELAGPALITVVGEGGVVRDLAVRDVDMVAGDHDVGVVAGVSRGSLENVSASGRVWAGGYPAGGVVGENEGTVTGAFANVSLQGSADTGGLVGENAGTVARSRAVGNATSTGGTAGGLVGENEGFVTRSSAAGATKGSSNVGGLVGENEQWARGVSHSAASGYVSGQTSVGGLVGHTSGPVWDSYATGTVRAQQSAGGLVGTTYDTNVTAAYATGPVSSAEGPAGGAIGSREASYGETTVAGVYYDANRTGQSGGPGTPRSTTAMTGDAAADLGGLDFQRNWTTTDRYPALRATDTDRTPGAGGLAIAVDLPDQRLERNDTVRGRIVLTEAPDGLAGTAFDVAVAEPAVASVQHASPGERLDAPTNVTIAPDNASVFVQGADLTESIEPGAENVTLATVTLSADGAGTTDVDVAVEDYQNDAGEFQRPLTWSDRLTVGGTPETPAWNLTTAEDRIGRNRTVQATITAPRLPRGVAGYALTVDVDNGSVAGIDDASAGEGFGITEATEMGEDNTSVFLRGADLRETVEPGAENVTVATLTLRSRDAGSTDVSVTVEEVQGDDGQYYAPAASGTTLGVANVTSEPINGTLPQDVDENWKYEDLTGNGEVDFQDVIVYFQYMDDPVMTDHVRAYDYSGNGEIDYQDLVALFEMV